MCVFVCTQPSAHRSDGEGQDGHHPVPQANQLPQLPLLLPVVARFSQQTGDVDQYAQAEKHRLDHLQTEGEVSKLSLQLLTWGERRSSDGE